MSEQTERRIESLSSIRVMNLAGDTMCFLKRCIDDSKINWDLLVDDLKGKDSRNLNQNQGDIKNQTQDSLESKIIEGNNELNIAADVGHLNENRKVDNNLLNDQSLSHERALHENTHMVMNDSTSSSELEQEDPGSSLSVFDSGNTDHAWIFEDRMIEYTQAVKMHIKREIQKKTASTQYKLSSQQQQESEQNLQISDDSYQHQLKHSGSDSGSSLSEKGVHPSHQIFTGLRLQKKSKIYTLYVIFDTPKVDLLQLVEDVIEKFRSEENIIETQIDDDLHGNAQDQNRCNLDTIIARTQNVSFISSQNGLVIGPLMLESLSWKVWFADVIYQTLNEDELKRQLYGNTMISQGNADSSKYISLTSQKDSSVSAIDSSEPNILTHGTIAHYQNLLLDRFQRLRDDVAIQKRLDNAAQLFILHKMRKVKQAVLRMIFGDFTTTIEQTIFHVGGNSYGGAAMLLLMRMVQERNTNSDNNFDYENFNYDDIFLAIKEKSSSNKTKNKLKDFSRPESEQDQNLSTNNAILTSISSSIDQANQQKFLEIQKEIVKINLNLKSFKNWISCIASVKVASDSIKDFAFSDTPRGPPVLTTASNQLQQTFEQNLEWCLMFFDYMESDLNIMENNSTDSRETGTDAVAADSNQQNDSIIWVRNLTKHNEWLTLLEEIKVILGQIQARSKSKKDNPGPALSGLKASTCIQTFKFWKQLPGLENDEIYETQASYLESKNNLQNATVGVKTYCNLDQLSILSQNLLANQQQSMSLSDDYESVSNLVTDTHPNSNVKNSKYLNQKYFMLNDFLGQHPSISYALNGRASREVREWLGLAHHQFQQPGGKSSDGQLLIWIITTVVRAMKEQIIEIIMESENQQQNQNQSTVANNEIDDIIDEPLILPGPGPAYILQEQDRQNLMARSSTMFLKIENWLLRSKTVIEWIEHNHINNLNQNQNLGTSLDTDSDFDSYTHNSNLNDRVDFDSNFRLDNELRISFRVPSEMILCKTKDDLNGKRS